MKAAICRRDINSPETFSGAASKEAGVGTTSVQRDSDKAASYAAKNVVTSRAMFIYSCST